MVSAGLAAAVALVGMERLAELRYANQNRQQALQQGAVEHGAAHYPLFFILHGAWFAGWVVEGSLSPELFEYWPLCLGLFAAAQILRYWCITSLGGCWNTRILVIPGASSVRCGPYRVCKHPNYIAVAVELAILPLIFGAYWTALIASAANAVLILGIRLPVERRALRLLNIPEGEKRNFLEEISVEAENK